jgi:HK97 family phage major capsid protein
MNVRELQQQRAALIGQARTMIDKADSEKRELTAEELVAYNATMSQIDKMSADIERRAKLDAQQADAGTFERRTGADPNIGLSPKEIRQYSIVRAINAIDAAKTGNPGALDAAGLEMEASRAVAKKLGREPRGFFVPYDWVARNREPRALTAGALTAGGYLVQTDVLAQDFIDVLRNRMFVQAAGATILTGLEGNILIPSKTAPSTAYWVAENSAPTVSQPVLGQVPLTPKTVGAYIDLSRRLIIQSSLDVEAMVRDDLARTLAVAIDLAALHGSGQSYQPKGVAAQSGIGAVYAGGAADNTTNANGHAPVWADIVNLESSVATANADLGALAYFVNAKTRGLLKQTPKIGTTYPVMIWGDGNTPLNGYPAFTTNQVSAALSKGTSSTLSGIFFGNWNDVVIGLWSGLDILVDPYTGSNAGTVRVVALQDCDINVRRVASFALCSDVVA